MAARRHDIDALRVAGTLLVFLFHNIQPFNPGDHWHVESAEKSEALGLVIRFLNLWVMQLFMLLAGASTFYALKARSNWTYLKERGTRIFLPLVLGILLVVAPQVYWQRRLSGAFTGSYAEFYPHFFQGTYPTGNFSWHHLWFLAYLFCYSVAGLFVFRALGGRRGQRLIAGAAALCGRLPAAILLPALPLALFDALLYRRFPQTNALADDWAWHAQLFTVFVYGYVLVADERFAAAIARAWRPCLALALAATPVALAGVVDSSLLYRGVGWLWLVALLGAAQRYGQAPSAALAYLSASSLPFYILHQMFIVAVAYALAGWSGPVAGKWPALALTAFAGTVVALEICRRVPPLRWALGMGFRAR